MKKGISGFAPNATFKFRLMQKCIKFKYKTRSARDQFHIINKRSISNPTTKIKFRAKLQYAGLFKSATELLDLKETSFFFFLSVEIFFMNRENLVAQH